MVLLHLLILICLTVVKYFQTIPVTPAEVSQLLRSMSNKSPPLDYISTSLLESCANTFSILISHLANLSFTQATFPSKFKMALISSLLKKSGLSKSDLANFRPISNLNAIGKFLEHLALSRFFPHISKSPSFSLLQSAYRKFHSTAYRKFHSTEINNRALAQSTAVCLKDRYWDLKNSTPTPKQTSSTTISWTTTCMRTTLNLSSIQRLLTFRMPS